MELAQYLYSQIATGSLDEQDGQRFLAQVLPTDIAIVGMSCEFTGAADLFSFEEMLRSGRNGFRTFPESRQKFFPRDHRYLVDAAKAYGRDPEELFQAMCDQRGGYLDDVDQFDAEFFEIPEDEAVYVDPMHRLVLKHLYLALEHSGTSREEIQGTRTAIYVGKDRSVAGSYSSEIEADSPLINPGTWEGILASRLNYLYDLKGGSLVIDTACSSSLVATHIAKKMLRDHEIDVALVGGIALGLAPRQGEVFNDFAGVETKNDYLKVFDQASSGTIFGEGVGIVVLRRLPDAIAHHDHVYSILRASGLNSDGKSNGLTAPNPKAQTSLIAETYALASISPATIDYVDAHGTGTKLGDPIEIRGLTDAFRLGGMTGYSTCALSSLKENVGHTVGASGVGGMIKMSLALDSRLIYPASGFEVPNDFIKFIDTPFYVPNTLLPWGRREHPRRGAVSGFGFSGTNGHVVLEESEPAERAPHAGEDLPFILSAPSAAQLRVMISAFLDHEGLIREKDLRDIAYTLLRRRRRFPAAVGFRATSHDGFFGGLRDARRALDGQESDDVVVSDAASDATGGQGSAALKILSRRLKEMPGLLTLDDRVQLTVREDAGFLDDWDFSSARVCALPGHVFETTSFWGRVKTYNVYDSSGGLPGTPVEGQLLSTKVLSTPSADLYSMRLDLSRWFLTDHQISGHPTLSGTAYTQLAAELAQIYFRTPAFSLSRMMFRSLIQVTEPRVVFVEVTLADGGERAVEVFSQTEDPSAPVVVHGSFVLSQLDPGSVAQGPGLDVDTSGLQPWLISVEGPSEDDSSGMVFAGRWDIRRNPMRHLALSPTDHIISFSIAEEYIQDTEDFYLSPAMLDLLAGMISGERGIATGRSYLPLSYGKVRFTGRRLTPTCTSRTQLRYDVGSDPLVATGDVWIYNDAGELVVQLERYAMRALTISEAAQVYHEVVWETCAGPSPHRLEPDRSVLLVGDPADTVDVLARLVDVESTGVTACAPEALGDRDDKVDTLVYLVPSTDTVSQVDELLPLFDRYLEVAKAAPRALRPGGQLVVLATHGIPLPETVQAAGSGHLDAVQYAMLSAARVIAMENPKVTVTAVSDVSRDLLQALALADDDSFTGRRTLMVGQDAYGETLHLHAGAAVTRAVPPGSTILMTGGFGGVGIAYIHVLWYEHQCSVVVLGRRSLDDLEASDNEADRDGAGQLRAMQSDGLQLEFRRCDVGDPAQVQLVLKELLVDRSVSGVVHLAGVPESAMVFRKSAEDLRHVVAAKVVGAAALLAGLGDQPLAFFITSSSMTTVTGAPGQFGYTLANAFLEGLAHAGTGVNVSRWPGWQETGMAVAFGVATAPEDAFLIKPFSTRRALEYVRKSITTPYVDLILGDLTSGASEMLAPYVRVGEPTAGAVATQPGPDAVKQSTGDGPGSGAGPAIPDFNSLVISGIDRELDDLEKYITVLFAAVLERTEIDVAMSFTDMGGDSLKAFSIYTPLVQHLTIDLEVADIFIYSSVLELSEYARGSADG